MQKIFKIYSFLILLSTASAFATINTKKETKYSLHKETAMNEKTKEPTYYPENFVDLIETVYGEGFLSQGGNQSIDHMFEDINLYGKKLLDIGSGIGGADIYLAQKYNVDIIGVDVESFVVEEAKRRLSKAQNTLKGKVTFVLEAPTDYLKQFDDQTFNVIFSKESILHIPVEDKNKYFEQVYRVLKDGGQIIIMDWMHKSPEYSNELRNMIEIDELPYNLVTPKEYTKTLNSVGFKDVEFEDTSKQTTELSKEDCDKIIALKDDIVSKFGQETYDSALFSWRAQANIFENGELITGIFRARKV